MSDYKCIICGETDPEYFRSSKHFGFCGRCEDIMDYWYKEAFQDINTVAKAENGKEMTRLDFEQAVIDFLGW